MNARQSVMRRPGPTWLPGEGMLAGWIVTGWRSGRDETETTG